MEREWIKTLMMTIHGNKELLDRLLAMNKAGDQFQCLVAEGVLNLDEMTEKLTARLNNWRDVHRRRSYTKALHLANCAEQMVDIPSRTVGKSLEGLYDKAIGLLPSLVGEVGERYDNILALSLRLYMARAKMALHEKQYNACINDLYMLTVLLDVDQSSAIEQIDLVDNARLFQLEQPKESMLNLAHVLFTTLKCFHRMEMINDKDYKVMRKALLMAVAKGDKIEDHDKEHFIELTSTLVYLLKLNASHSNFNEFNVTNSFGDIVKDDGKDKVVGRYVLSEKVKTVRIEGKGRGWVANDEAEGLKKDETILVERPFCVMVDAGFIGRHCDYCLGKINTSPVSCSLCNETIYCSVECLQAARVAYHYAECGHLGMVRSIGGSATLLYRIINQVGLDRALAYDDTYSPTSYSVDDYLADAKLNVGQQFEESEMFATYRMVTSLIEHNDRPARSVDLYFLLSSVEVTLIKAIADRNLSSVLFDEDGRVKSNLMVNIVQLFYVQLKRILVNIFGFYDLSEPSPKPSKSNLIGNCQFLLSSLFNHSCEPNVKWNIVNGHMMFRALRDIAPGEELVISYGASRPQPLEERQESLYQSYHFVCDCELCLADSTTSELVIGCTGKDCYGPVVLKKFTAHCLRCGQDYPVELVKIKLALLEKSRTFLKHVAQLDLEMIEEVGNKESLLGGQLEDIEANVEEIDERYSDGIHYIQSVYYQSDLLLLAKVWMKLNRSKPAFDIASGLFSWKPSELLPPELDAKDAGGDDNDRLASYAQAILDHHWWVGIINRDESSAAINKFNARLFITLLVVSYKLCLRYITLLLKVREQQKTEKDEVERGQDLSVEMINLVYGISLADIVCCFKKVYTSHSIPMEQPLIIEDIYPIQML